MRTKILISFCFLFIMLAPLALPFPVLAQESMVDTTSLDPNSTDEHCKTKYDCGNYSLNDMVRLAVRASRWILGIVGSLALLMFIYGGFTFLISSGSSEQVKKAKNIIVAAVIGLAIVFCSFLIIQYVMNTLGLTWNGSNDTPTSTSQIVR